MAELSPGQQDALQDLKALEMASDSSIELVRQTVRDDGTLDVDVSINCHGFAHRAPGLQLRDRERFWLVLDSEFPLEPPTVFAPEHRFAFSDHVYWAGSLGVWICLYYSSDHQWEPSQGIAGFFNRLLQWLELASIGELDAPGLPRHPPIPGGKEDSTFFVARADCPPIEDDWTGFAVLDPRSGDRMDIVDWTKDVQRHADSVLAPAILLNRRFISEFPADVSSLIQVLQIAGVGARALAVRLLLHIKNTKKRPPVYLILGVAMRGPKGGAADQHLFVWKFPDRTANDLRNLCKRHKRVNEQTLEQLLTKCEAIVAKLRDSRAHLIHCRVHDQRPTVSHRRDEKSPLTGLRGKTVTLWGAGGLGSYVAEMLVRSGVKRLRVLDYGRVKPGLLVRQNFVDADIGDRKTDALAKRLGAIDAKVEIEPIAANLLRHQKAVKRSLTDTELLIDATASRRVAMIIDRYLIVEGPQRFPITSVGNDVDAARGLITYTPPNSRLGPTDLLHRSYLALCDQDDNGWLDAFWPQDNEDDWFEPEPGCSSPTFHGSGAQTASLAGCMLAETARLVAESSTPTIVGVSPLGALGSIVRLEVSDTLHGTCPETGNDVRFLAAASAAIDESIESSAKNEETGGILFGFRDDYLKIVWVVDASGPPADSEASETEFVCGVEGVAEMVKDWQYKTHDLVGFLGTWHSHPVSSPTPSVTDLSAMKHLLRQSGSPLHRLLLTIVGHSSSNPEFGTYVFGDKDDLPGKSAA